MKGPTTTTNSPHFGMVCDGCEYLTALKAMGQSRAEVIDARCNHPGNDAMFLKGMLLAMGHKVDTPNDCPVLVGAKDMN